MLKITLPNGVVIEGELNDLGQVVQNIIALPQPEEAVSAPEPEPEKETVSVVIPEPEPEPKPQRNDRPASFPHRYAQQRDYRSMAIGERQDQVMQAAKLIAEQAGNRSEEFKTRDVLEVLNDNETTIWVVGSALQGLAHKGLVRHGKHSRCWYITEAGWATRYRINQPVRQSVRPTT